MSADSIIVIYSICGALALFIVCVLVFFCVCRRRVPWFGRRPIIPQLHVVSVPTEGVYPSPLIVQLTALQPNVDILVRIVRQDEPFPPPTSAPAAEQLAVSGFLLYRDELVFDYPGTYYVMTHTISDSKKLSELQQFCFIVTGAVSFSSHLAPPRIIPSAGEVTTSTRIQLLPNERNANNLQALTFRYSIDGSFPYIPYVGPFFLPLEKNQNQAVVTVSAIAVDGKETSSVERAALTVFPARSAYFDPSIPAPTAKLMSSGSRLYFEDCGIPNTRVVYQLDYLNERRHKDRSSNNTKNSNSYSYNRGEMIDIAKDVARIVAWTVDERNEKLRSQPAVYDASRQVMSYPSDLLVSGVAGGMAPPLPPPVMCVACSDFAVTFDEPPAKGEILYTLNNAEPDVDDDIGTFRYRPSQPLSIGQGEYKQLFVTARTYIRDDGMIDEGGGDAMVSSGGLSTEFRRTYRFGNRFYRGFFFS